MAGEAFDAVRNSSGRGVAPSAEGGNAATSARVVNCPHFGHFPCFPAIDAETRNEVPQC